MPQTKTKVYQERFIITSPQGIWVIDGTAKMSDFVQSLIQDMWPGLWDIWWDRICRDGNFADIQYIGLVDPTEDE